MKQGFETQADTYDISRNVGNKVSSAVVGPTGHVSGNAGLILPTVGLRFVGSGVNPEGGGREKNEKFCPFAQFRAEKGSPSNALSLSVSGAEIASSRPFFFSSHLL